MKICSRVFSKIFSLEPPLFDLQFALQILLQLIDMEAQNLIDIGLPRQIILDDNELGVKRHLTLSKA